MADLANTEALLAAHDAHVRAQVLSNSACSSSAFVAEARAFSKLYDAARRAGMSDDEPSVTEWAAGRIADFLCAA